MYPIRTTPHYQSVYSGLESKRRLSFPPAVTQSTYSNRGFVPIGNGGGPSPGDPAGAPESEAFFGGGGGGAFFFAAKLPRDGTALPTPDVPPDPDPAPPPLPAAAPSRSEIPYL